ncbi:MAG: hypothetical protein WB507_09290 [Solirubrobacterales bacterium]
MLVRRAVIGLLAAIFALATLPAVSLSAGLGQHMAKFAKTKAKRCKKGQVRKHGKCVKEVRLSARSCEGLLPGFSAEISGPITAVTGGKGGVQTTANNGVSISSCPFEDRNGSHISKRGNEEEVFNGLLALFVTAEKWPTERGAQGEFRLRRAVAGSLEDSILVPTTRVGDEAYLWAQTPVTNSYGEEECASSAGVRVDNIEVIYSLGGFGPEAGEACGATALALLKDVAAGVSK